MGVIYLIQNQIDGKQYIGQTVGTLVSRFRSHLSLSDHPEHPGHSALHRAIAKHGKENFSVSLICNGERGDELDGMEEMFIEMYNTAVPKGYNIRLGAVKSGVRSAGYKRKDTDLPLNVYKVSSKGQEGYSALHPASGRSYKVTSVRLTMEEKLVKVKQWLAEAEGGNITRPLKTRKKYDLPPYVKYRGYGNIRNRYYSSRPGQPVQWFLTLEETVAYVNSSA